MDKVKLALDIAQKLFKVADDLKSLADSLHAVCTLVTDSLQENKAAEIVKSREEEHDPTVSLEKVRGVLADKSRAGFTSEVREILKKHGADRLSGIDPKEYPAVLAEAEALS